MRRALPINARDILSILSSRGIYSCTSNGALRLTSPTTSQTASLPTRLCDWHLSSDQESFAYGGEEVELSVWNTEQAFVYRTPQADPDVSGKKRKRGDALFPGEIWRAKNVNTPSPIFTASDAHTRRRSLTTPSDCVNRSTTLP